MDKFPSLPELGRIVRQKRKLEKLSQKALADLVGVSHVTVIAIEKGAGQARLENAWKILKGLGLTMVDDMPKTGKPDPDRINVNEPYEIRDWANKFGVSEEHLRAAVKKAGPMARDVAKTLGKAQ